MDIPDICNSWSNKIESGSAGDKRILGNLRKDNCIKPKITRDFFKQLADKGSPNTPDDARNAAIDIVKADSDRFVCQGRKIPGSSFNTFLRLENVRKIKRLFDPGYLSSFGLRDKNMLNRTELPDDELNDIIQMFNGELNLGSLLDVVWVADNEGSEQIDLMDLIDRLGIVDLEDDERCLKLVYKRKKTKKDLHLPRSFDGIDNSQFELVENCKANSGKTLPLNLPPEQGLPEAVHRGCKVKPEIFEVKLLK